MTIHHLDTRFTANRHSPAPRAFFAFGLWLRTGVVALSAAAIALIMLTDGEVSRLPAMASVIAGIGVAAFAWRKAWSLIDALEPSKRVNAETTSAPLRPARLVAPIESAASR